MNIRRTAGLIVEHQIARAANKLPILFPVPTAAALLAVTRFLQARPDEAQAYAWLAGLRRTPPVATSSGHTSDFDSQEYFVKLEDPAYQEYTASNRKLVEWSTPERSASICDFGCGRGFLLHELKRTGYTNLTGFEISQTAVAHAVTSEVQLFPGFTQLASQSYTTVCLISVLEHIEPTQLTRFVQEITRIAAKNIVCCVPVYPDNLRDFFDRDLSHRTLASRAWWDRQFARYGFMPAPLPPEPLPYIAPFFYQRHDAR